MDENIYDKHIQAAYQYLVDKKRTRRIKREQMHVLLLDIIWITALLVGIWMLTAVFIRGHYGL
jgi:hypothetical protein